MPESWPVLQARRHSSLALRLVQHSMAALVVARRVHIHMLQYNLSCSSSRLVYPEQSYRFCFHPWASRDHLSGADMLHRRVVALDAVDDVDSR